MVDEAETKKPAVEYVHTNNIPDLFGRLNISLLVSTYQAQRIMSFSSNKTKLSMLMRVMPRPTGLALDEKRLAVCSQHQVWVFNTAFDVQDTEGKKEPNDVWFVPRKCYVTGDILGHEMAWIKNGQSTDLNIVNTRFSCICKVSDEWSFETVWKPKFITKIAAEDRCHLNGMAVENRQIKYVSALAESDKPEDWRDKRVNGGIIIDYASGEIVTRGLCMPHSPRVYDNKLWVLDSGQGQLKLIDPKNGKQTTVLQLGGYLRGLAFLGNFAFIGLCKIREKKTFGGLPIEEKFKDLPCAIHIINLKTGASEGFIEFKKGIEEIFDIQLLQGARNPEIVGFEEDTIKGLFILPS
jgi:uncharacterized protein (TIGR03032 family)